MVLNEDSSDASKESGREAPVDDAPCMAQGVTPPDTTPIGIGLPSNPTHAMDPASRCNTRYSRRYFVTAIGKTLQYTVKPCLDICTRSICFCLRRGA